MSIFNNLLIPVFFPGLPGIAPAISTRWLVITNAVIGNNEWGDSETGKPSFY